MSTRGIIGFVLDDQLKIQYNHSDSYPSFTGERVLHFVKGWLPRLDELRTQVRAVEIIGDDDGVCELEEPGELAPMLTSRRILSAEQFALDSRYCEWGYLVNLDHERLEVYRGFNEQPATTGRWAYVLPVDVESQHWPINLVASFPFGELPASLERALPKVKTPWNDGECYVFDLERTRPAPNAQGRYEYPVYTLRMPFGTLRLHAQDRETVVVSAERLMVHRVALSLGATIRWHAADREWMTHWGDWRLKRVVPLQGKDWRREESPTTAAEKLVRVQVLAAITQWANARSEAFWRWLDFISGWNEARTTLFDKAQAEAQQAVNRRREAEEHEAKAEELERAYARAITRLTPPEPVPV